MSKPLLLSFGALAIAAFASIGPAAAKTCFSGYHLDTRGHCQPNHPIPPREICPKGYYAHNAPNAKGYRCKSYP